MEQHNEMGYYREESKDLLPIIQMKVCFKCKTKKPQSNFSRDIRAGDGLYSQCKDCHSECCNRRNATHEGKEKIKKYQRSYQGKEVGRKRVYKRLYNITIDDYDKILASQGGVCAICGTDVPGGTGRFHVDHDHKRNKVRGVLCINCNRMLGNAKDNVRILDEGIKYLSKYDIYPGALK